MRVRNTRLNNDCKKSILQSDEFELANANNL